VGLAVGAVVGLLPPLWAALAIAGSVMLACGLVRPAWPLYLLGLAAPLASAVDFGLGGMRVSATEGLIGVALLAYLLVLLSGREERSRLSPWAAPIAIFLLIGLLSTGWASSASAAAKELLRWVELGAAFGLAVALVRSQMQARIVIAVLLAGGIGEAALGAVQFVLQIGPPSYEVGRFLRAYGTFGQPNPYAGYLGIVLPLAVAIVWTHMPRLREEWVWTGYALLAAGAAAAGLGMSLSRGAWLGSAIGLTVLLMAAGRRSLAAVLIGGFVLLLVALLGAFELLPAGAIERVASISRYFGAVDVRAIELNADTWAVVERMAHWEAARSMWEASPIFGVGIGQYAFLYEYFKLTGWDDPLGHAHNYYLNVAAELGGLGLTAYLGMVASWLVMAFRAARMGPSPLARAVGLAALGTVAGSATHNVFDNLYVAGMNVHIGLLLGLAAGSSRWGARLGGE